MGTHGHGTRRATSAGGRRGPRATARRASLIAVTALTVAAGCTATGDPGDTGAPSGVAPTTGSSTEVLADLSLVSSLQPFDACEDLLGYVKDQALQRVTAYGLSGGGYPGDLMPLAGDRASSAEGPTSVVPAAPGEFSTSDGFETATASGGAADETAVSGTNVQEEGVDEPDTVKSDARRILTVADNRLQYVDVTGETPVVTGALDLPDAGSAQLLVDGDRVLVISENGAAGYDELGPGRPVPSGASSSSWAAPSEVTLTLVDASAPTELRILTSVRIDGRSVSARMIDGRARIVTTATAAALPFVYPSGPGGEETAEETNRRIISESTIDDWLPHVRTGTGTSETDPGEVAVACENVRHPKEFAGFDILTVQTVDLSGDAISTGDATAIMANGQTVYASAQNLYVATPSYVESPDVEPATTNGSTGGTSVPGTTGTTPGTAPAPQPTTTVVDPDQDDRPEPWEPPKETTSIHRFGISDPGPAVYRASGEVPGHLLNQFSMSEHDDRLRVATTDGWGTGGWGTSSGAPESWVRVLEERDGSLDEVGAVGGLGKNEQIKSVRFIGDRGYVVTFRQTDPLYTVDLSDPTAPRVAGELKILGYSAYLHPAGDGLLIGIGQDATEQGRATGTQVALFDVSDAANPRQIQKHLVGVGSSAAEQDHHAFLWWGPASLAVIPVQNYDQGWYLNGAIGYTITPDGITEVGRIRHPSSFADGDLTGWGGPTTTVPGGSGCDPAACEPLPPAPCVSFGACDPSGVDTTAIDRALVIGDRVYTVSPIGVLASRIDDLSAIGGVDFE